MEIFVHIFFVLLPTLWSCILAYEVSMAIGLQQNGLFW